MSSEKKIEVKPKKNRRPPPPSFPPDMNPGHINKFAQESVVNASLPPNNTSVEDVATVEKKVLPDSAIASNQEKPSQSRQPPQQPFNDQHRPSYAASLGHMGQHPSYHPYPQHYGHYPPQRHEHPRSDHSPNRTPYERHSDQRDQHYPPYGAQQHHWSANTLPPSYYPSYMPDQQRQRFPGQSPMAMFDLEDTTTQHPNMYNNSSGYGYDHRHPYHAQGQPHYYNQHSTAPGSRRAPPPQEYPSSVEDSKFQPYVDSDYQPVSTRPHPYVDRPIRSEVHSEPESERLGENRPSTFTVSVTSLSSVRTSIDCPEQDDDEPQEGAQGVSNHGEKEINNGVESNIDSKENDPVGMVKKHCFISSDQDEKPMKKGLKENKALKRQSNDNFKNTQQGAEIGSIADDSLFFLSAKESPFTSPKQASSRKAMNQKKKSASFSGYRKCLIMRDRKGVKNRLNPTYNLYTQDVTPGTPPQLIMIAQKTTSRTSNYRFFDMRSINTTDKLDKHARNYVGKLRGNFNRDEYTAYGRNKEVICAVVYDKSDVLSQIKDGAIPRRMGVLLPYDKIASKLEELNSPTVLSPTRVERNLTDSHSEEETKSDEENKDGSTPEQRLANMFNQVENKMNETNSIRDEAPKTSVANILQGKLGKCKSTKQYLQLSSKQPSYEKNSYRLNFHGRVKLPSVKNYQLIQPDGDNDNVWTQFGKVTEDKFHLDYKEPMDMFSAFALAITQFDY